MYNRYVKRILDVLLSLIAIIVLGIPMLIIALIVRIDVGSPVLFSQKRIGKGEREFKIYKFRTMTNEKNENGVYLPDPERTTRFGHFIRITSIDELPSLINVIKGDMSIIGPRPLPSRYLPRYSKEQRRRHDVRPGLSSPSIINGRNSLSWESQFEGDIWYVNHVSLWIDVKSIIATIKIVLSHKGATASDGGSRGEFIGTASAEQIMTDSEGSYMKIQ